MKKTIFALLLFYCMSMTLPTTTFAQTLSVQEQTVNKPKNVVAKKIILSQKEAESIDTIQIDWKKGQTTVSKSPDEKIYILEKAYVMPKDTQKVGISIKNNTLFITDYTIMPYFPQREDLSDEQYQKIQQEYENTTYDLEVLLPQKQYEEFYFNTTNAGCILDNHSFKNITTESIYGDFSFYNIKADTISAKTVKGTITLAQNTSAEQYHLYNVSGKIDAQFSLLPTQLHAKSENGTIVITLPENEGFFLSQKNINNYHLQSSFSLINKNDKKIYKNGTVALDILCRNGTVILKKLEKEISSL